MLNVLYKAIHVTTGPIALRKASGYRTYSHSDIYIMICSIAVTHIVLSPRLSLICIAAVTL